MALHVHSRSLATPHFQFRLPPDLALAISLWLDSATSSNQVVGSLDFGPCAVNLLSSPSLVAIPVYAFRSLASYSPSDPHHTSF